MILLNYLMLNFFSFLLLILMMLLSVGFLVLLERKELGYMQLRKGPNKVGILGIFQPFSDAIKLFTNEVLLLSDSMIMMFYLMPILMILSSMIIWILLPFEGNIFSMKYSALLMMCFLGFGVYPVMIEGWSSNSNYSMLGALRSVAQSISYEVSLFLIMFVFYIMFQSYSFLEYQQYQENLWNLFIFMPVFIFWVISLLAELNRTPFDLVEGESELVSGFNTEYFSWGFALIFMSEYLMIMFMSVITVILFTGLKIYSLGFLFLYFLVLFMVIFIRGLLPRIRYDQLMEMCWKMVLPGILMYLFFVMNFVFLFE